METGSLNHPREQSKPEGDRAEDVTERKIMMCGYL